MRLNLVFMKHTTFLRVLYLLPLFIFAILFMSCFGAGKLNNSANVVIGALYNYTGTQSALDVPSSKGVLLAIEQANSNGGILGRHVELVLKKGNSKTETVKKQTADLIKETPAATAIIGLSDTDMVLAAAPVAAESKKVFLTSGATSPRLPQQVPEYLFLACFGDNVQAAAAADWAYNDTSARTASMLFNSSQTYTRLLKGYFETRFVQLGGQIISVQEFTPENLGNLNLELKKADIVFLSAENPQEALQAIGILRKSGFSSPIIGGDGFDSEDLWRMHPEINNVYFTTHAYLGSDNPDPKVINFRKAYMNANKGSTPNAFSALGYDTANLIMTAISKANSTDPDLARKSLMTIRNFEGITGTISYSPSSRIPKKSVSIIKIDKGNRSLVKQILPSQVPAP